MLQGLLVSLERLILYAQHGSTRAVKILQVFITVAMVSRCNFDTVDKAMTPLFTSMIGFKEIGLLSQGCKRLKKLATWWLEHKLDRCLHTTLTSLRWIVVDKIGSGAFGTVIKVLSSIGTGEFAAKGTKKDLFHARCKKYSLSVTWETEATIMRAVGSHPNLIYLHKAHQCRGWQILILEYAQSGDLLQHIVSNSCLEPQEAALLFEQVCAGLSFLHAQKVAHRDVKPENVLLKENSHGSVAMLADLGLARFCQGGCYSLVGTPQYRAPEIWFHKTTTCNNNGYDEMVDSWSAGVTLFAMLAGELPFDDEDLEARICKGDICFQESFQGQPLLDLHHVIFCLVVMDPAIRFSSEEARIATLASNLQI